MRFIQFLLFTACLVYGCSGLDDSETPENFIAESKYSFNVTSSIGGNHSFSVEGSTTTWDPSIGYMGLGPEANAACDLERASLSMFANEDVDFNSEIVTSLKWSVDIDFYSILYWCLPLGDQEANYYSSTEPLNISQEVYEFGIDELGVKYFKGEFVIVLNRDILNTEDVDEEIVVFADFVAVDR